MLNSRVNYAGGSLGAEDSFPLLCTGFAALRPNGHEQVRSTRQDIMVIAGTAVDQNPKVSPLPFQAELYCRTALVEAVADICIPHCFCGPPAVPATGPIDRISAPTRLRPIG